MARKADPHDSYRLVGAYERLRKTLRELPEDQSPDESVLDKHLSYWVLPADKRLPIAFLDQTLGSLLELSLEELLATPGVGKKKIISFFDLLRRAIKTAKGKPGKESHDFGLKDKQHASGAPREAGVFDPTVVSEEIWKSWRETVTRAGLEGHKLGRVAPSLRPLPTVVWHTPLSEYTHRTLGEIRRLKTHGEKRVRAILEVFCTIHEALSTSVLNENLDLELLPRFIPPLTRWLGETAWAPTPPTAEEVRERVITPMVQQVEIDLGEQIATLAAQRLRLHGEAPSVTEQAEGLGLTRARVYQLLDECARAMEVRWPEGRWLLAPLRSNLDGASPESMALVHGLRDLFYPEERPQGAAAAGSSLTSQTV